MSTQPAGSGSDSGPARDWGDGGPRTRPSLSDGAADGAAARSPGGQVQAAASRLSLGLDRLTLPLITTWPAFTEAMYLVGRAGAWTAQEALWRLVRRGELVVASPSATAVERASELMETYSDRPMDLADATLIALAEEQDHKRVFTLDADFSIYGLKGNRYLEIVPAPPRRRL